MHKGYVVKNENADIIENADILDQRSEKVQIAHDFGMIGSQFLNQ